MCRARIILTMTCLSAARFWLLAFWRAFWAAASCAGVRPCGFTRSTIRALAAKKVGVLFWSRISKSAIRPFPPAAIVLTKFRSCGWSCRMRSRSASCISPRAWTWSFCRCLLPLPLSHLRCGRSLRRRAGGGTRRRCTDRGSSGGR
ncbi:hypothetical protein B0T19DRAFT_415508 [Cercophora scortea]|uniref:Uncharacterized protein n=1 Tax=Cercophora scortea TaxID=314031 RepID=A0AAE0IWE6_9PEZI|nr:hypothetical protein B0T19DRAFT_415508 [Cercophora scortea]